MSISITDPRWPIADRRSPIADPDGRWAESLALTHPLTHSLTPSHSLSLTNSSVSLPGYFIAGSLLGQGGFGLAKEIVQLQSVSQLGVQFLLFMLGLELNLTKLKAVRNVALFGGIIQVALMSAMGAVVAFLIGAGSYHGAFVGALLAMSSTSIVVKCIQEARVRGHVWPSRGPDPQLHSLLLILTPTPPHPHAPRRCRTSRTRRSPSGRWSCRTASSGSYSRSCPC